MTEDLPRDMLKGHRKVTSEIDMLHVNQIPFVRTISRGKHFGTVVLVKKKKEATIATATKQFIQAYNRRGFK